MKKVSEIKYWLLCLVAFTIGAYIFINGMTYAIVLYAIAWVIEGDFKRKIRAFAANKFALLFSGFYLLYVVGLAYSNIDKGLFNLQIKFGMLVLPFLLVSEGHIEVKKQKQLMYAFIAGCVVNGLTCLIWAIWKYNTQGVYEFEYMAFSFVHPSYFSMYIDLALLFIYYLFTNPGAGLTKAGKIGLVVSIFFLEFILVLLQSKMGMIVSAVVLITLLIKYAQKQGYAKPLYILVGLVAVYFLTYHFVIDGSSRAINSANNVVQAKTIDPSTVESNGARTLAWKGALQVIKGSPIIGVGTGNADTALVTQYLKDGYTGIAREHLNAHNQYLQTTVMLGIIGFLALLACLGLAFVKCIKERRFIYGAFIFIIAINFLAEAMLESQAGTVFYGFFNSLLMFNFVI